jgi:UDP-3-O-[3-hydroxymyristoyl] glucosamine N-acyltransferase
MADPRFHKKSLPVTLKALADIVSCEVRGSSEVIIEDVASLDGAEQNHVSFLDNVKYKDSFKNTKAGACIVSEKMANFAPDGCSLIISETPYKSYALIAQYFYPENYPDPQISDKAIIHDTVKIADGCVIEAGAVIARGVKLGKGSWVEANAVIHSNVEIGQKCRVGANATISHSIIGDHTRIYPGARIGQDGFGFAIDPAGHVKVPQLGRVIIGDHVEIGANSCIDRGAGPDTIIGDGSWIDNCVQIGHNVKIGKGCVIVAQAGIAGSTTLEDFVVVAAQGGVAGHLTVGQGAQIGAQSGVMNDIPAGEKVIGAPAVPFKEFMRQVVTLKKLSKK